MTECPHGMPSPKSCVQCMEDGNLEIVANSPERRDAPVITAEFESDCDACSNKIHEGDELVHTTKERWVHASCCPE